MTTGFLMFNLGLCVFFMGFLLYDVSLDIRNQKVAFNFQTGAHLFFYFSEIIGIFGLFYIMVDQPYIPLGYEAEGGLKRFIDFFTVYQIFIFAVLKLIDSLKLNSCVSFGSKLDMILPLVENRKLIQPEIIKSFKEFGNKKTNIVPENIRKDYNNLFLLLSDYEKNRELKNKNAVNRVQVIENELYALKIQTEVAKEELNYHWNVSLLLRFLKRF